MPTWKNSPISKTSIVAIFAAMLANMDDSVGSVMGQLRKSGLEENTIVFFLSDNGGPTKELTSSNLPLRGSKGQMYEGAIRVPFMMQWKGEIPSGQVLRQAGQFLRYFRDHRRKQRWSGPRRSKSKASI